MTRIALSSQRPKIAKGAVAMLGLGTTTPDHMLQNITAQLAEPLCCDNQQQGQFFNRLYGHCGVEARGSVLFDADDPANQRCHDFYRDRVNDQDHGPTTGARMELYARYAPGLAESAARAALADAELAPDQVTHLLPVTCTGFFSPGLDVELIRRLGLAPTVHRVQVGFMGCHGAFNAMATARDILAGDPRAVVLICCVELCSLHLAYGFDPQKIVANALFADGAAAVIIGSAERSVGGHACPTILASSTMLIPGSLDAMTWRIGDHGFAMTLSPKIPELVAQHVPQWLDTWLAGRSMNLADIELFAIHPGGPKVLSAVAAALDRPDEITAPAREVLRAHGNMSSATILFVLQNLLASGAQGPCLALGFGPGLTAEGLLLEI